MPTAGLQLRAGRTYETTRQVDGPLGYGWKSSLTARLVSTVYLITPPSTVETEADVLLPDGRKLTFVNAGSGFVPRAGHYDRLVRNGDGTYELTLEYTNQILRFAASGQLVSMTDDFGNQLTYTYDNGGLLQRLADMSGSGRFVDVYWGADGRISALQDNTGRQVVYGYNSSGALVSVTDLAHRSTAYSYVQGRFSPLLSSEEDNWGRTVRSVSYDSSDRVHSYMEEGETWTYSYGYQGNPRSTAKTDSAGNIWEFRFLASGRVTDRIAPGGATRHADFYSDGRIQQEIDQSGVRTYYTYDALGRLASRTLDYQGPTAVRLEYSYDPAFPLRLIAVLPVNPVTGQRDPKWQAWRYDYYPSGSAAPGALFHVFRVQSDGSTLDTVKTIEYDARGRVTAEIDAGGARRDLIYDAKGDLATVVLPANNSHGERPVVGYEHDPIGRVTSVTDPLGRRSVFSYDSLNRVVDLTLPRPSAASPSAFVTTTAYDVYDPATHLLYQEQHDFNGRISRKGFDEFGRPVQEIDQLGGVTRYEYDGDALSSRTDPNNNTLRYAYDPLKRIATIIFPEGASESYTYWADDRVRTKTDRRANGFTYAYDHFGRLVAVSYSGGGSVGYTYIGQQLTTVVDSRNGAAEESAFSYDPSYRLASETEGGRGSITYTYTPGDQLASYSLSGRASAGYSYHPDGSLDAITWSLAPGPFTYSWLLDGRLSRIDFPNGQARTVSYDGQGRLTAVSNAHPATGVLADYGYEYDKDNATGDPTALGLETALQETVPSLGVANARTYFQYDSRNQLIGVDYPLGYPFNGEKHRWVYDSIGNRLTSAVDGLVTSYSYRTNGDGLNGSRLLSAGPVSWTYDQNGNAISRTAASQTSLFSYDADNRLTGGPGMAIRNDYRGRRALVDKGAEETNFYSDMNLISRTGAMDAQYLFGPGLDGPLAMQTQGALYYFATDRLGSVGAVTDAGGSVVSSYIYDSWGKVRGINEGLPNDIRFAGGEDDEQLGAYFFQARYYDATTGRFLAEDPLGPSTGGPYGYVDNNPTIDVDPLGLAGGRSQFCDMALRKIQRIQSRIDKRLRDLRDDPLGLPTTAFGDDLSPSLSRLGHVNLISRDKWLLAKWKALYLAFCNCDPPNGAPVWDEQGDPVDLFDRRWWTENTGLEGRALIWYLIISEGSRVFPPRDLIPVP